MKRAFSTLACMELSFEELLSTAVRHGMTGVEIRLDKDQKICGAGVEKAGAIREACEKYGVTITDLATGVTIQKYHPGLMETAKACADLASAAGCRAIRVFAGAGLPRFSDIPCHDEDGIVRFLGELCAYAAGIGVDVWLETHGPYSAAKDTRRLIEKTGAQNLYALWDFIHTIEYGETPEQSVEILRDRIAHVHLKDGIPTGDRNRTQFHHTALGEGDMPVGHVLNLLAEVNYSGFLSLEWELPWRPELKGCYPDTDATLEAYNRWLDSAEKNILPPITSGAWETFVPQHKPLAGFTKDRFGDTLEIDLASGSFGVGKWLCTVPVEAGKTYAFSVVCRTAEAPNDVYVLLTQKKADGKWLIREHAAECRRMGDRLFFSDILETVPEAASVTLELWCKGKYAHAAWFRPVLVPAAPIPERKVKIAIGYLKGMGNRTLEENREQMLSVVDKSGACRPDIIVLGECMYERGVDIPLPEKAETEGGVMCTLMRQKAVQYGCYIIYNFHEWDNGEIYNASLLIDREGKTAGKYRKTHLTVTELEAGLTPGEGYPVFDTDFGRIGMLICWDHYFSTTTEALVEKGAEVIFVSSAGDAAEQCIARARDGGVYLAVCGMNLENTYGWGPARVVSPLGELLTHGDAHGEP
ncbi:MAG: TIM barrel protein, partial [Clostridia bacterium]|nr:TIM barrel protein [Clostridia bacterium]